MLTLYKYIKNSLCYKQLRIEWCEDRFEKHLCQYAYQHFKEE